MSQSTLTISATPYNLDIFDYNGNEDANITEKQTIIDPDDYDAEASVITGNNHKRHSFSIKSKCTLAQRLIFISALYNHTKVYPVIYPGNGSTNIITASAYYYIKTFQESFKLANENCYFVMNCIYGGV